MERKKLSSDEKLLFCKIALVIARKGHLTVDALVRFSLAKHERKYGKKLVKKFYNLGLLQKHRTNTYELSKFGVRIAIKYCSKFRWKYLG